MHVFCAGCTGWMGWLHWAGFLCGPPANFMIYSAKGRGARPPVTTERELHVGLMISPQKCLLWLGLHGALSAPPAPPQWLNGGEGGGVWKESSADWPESIQTLTTTHLFGGDYEEEADRQRAPSDCHVPNVLNSCPSTNAVISACGLLFFYFSVPPQHTHTLPPPPPQVL